MPSFFMFFAAQQIDKIRPADNGCDQSGRYFKRRNKTSSGGIGYQKDDAATRAATGIKIFVSAPASFLAI